MSKLRILRREREIGFLEVPELETKSVPLPGFEGNQIGLAIVVELREAPIACVVYRLDGETLDITSPSRILWDRSEKPLPVEEAWIWSDLNLEALRSEPSEPRGVTEPSDQVVDSGTSAGPPPVRYSRNVRF